jgi:lipopolysaccharide heptosyltransferase II
MTSDPHQLIQTWKSLTTLVIGDAILDCYLKGHSDRLCQEDPAPVVEIGDRQVFPGGAANTSANIASLGGNVLLLSVIGTDPEGADLKQALNQRQVFTKAILSSSERKTLAKQRVMAGDQILVRLDQGDTEPIAPDLEQQLIDRLVDLYPHCDAVIVSDYGYGIVTPNLIQILTTLQARYRAVGATAVKPNYGEAIQLLGLAKQSTDRAGQLAPYGDRLLERTGAAIVAVTLDREGAIVFESGQLPYPIQVKPVPTHQTSGAGDTFISALTLALASGAATAMATDLASTAASIVVKQSGTTLCQAEELRQALIHQPEMDRPKMDRTEQNRLASTWDNAENILCIRLDTIGDVMMTTPAMQALKASHPNRRLTLMTSTAGAAIAPLIPLLDDLIVYDAPWLKATAPRIDHQPEYAMIEQLRQARFDAAIIFTVYSQNPLPSAFLCYLAGIPLRLAHCHENPYQLLTDWIKDPEPAELMRHEVQRQLDLVASVGSVAIDDRMKLQVTPVDGDRVQQLLKELGLEWHRPWVVIHPGATAPSRRYPPESFAIAARMLVEMGIQVIFTGTQPEHELVESIRQQMAVASYSLVDRLSLSELAALLSLAPLLISNNTGPVHIAAAVGTPVVDLYALTNLQHTPWGVEHRVLYHDVPCRLCYKSICPEGHHHCLRLVTPESVVQAALELLGDRVQPIAAASCYVNSSHCR